MKDEELLRFGTGIKPKRKSPRYSRAANVVILFVVVIDTSTTVTSRVFEKNIVIIINIIYVTNNTITVYSDDKACEVASVLGHCRRKYRNVRIRCDDNYYPKLFENDEFWFEII